MQVFYSKEENTCLKLQIQLDYNLRYERSLQVIGFGDLALTEDRYNTDNPVGIPGSGNVPGPGGGNVGNGGKANDGPDQIFCFAIVPSDTSDPKYDPELQVRCQYHYLLR